MRGGPTLVLGATWAELSPLVARIDRRGKAEDHPSARVGWFGAHEVVVAATGVGPQNARSAATRLLRRYAPHRVIVTGTAGATNPTLESGHVLVPAVVIEADGEQRWTPTWPADAAGTLLSGPSIIESPADKADVFARFGADAVDMETATIARLCAAADVPWLAVRAILDDAHTVLCPGLIGLTRSDGRTNLSAAIGYALSRPWKIPGLIRIGRDTQRAMEQAAANTARLL